MLHVSVSDISLSRLEDAETFLQSDFWGSFKSKFGWKPLAYMVRIRESANGIVSEFPLLVLLRQIKRAFSLAYIPYPVIDGIPPYITAGNLNIRRYRELFTHLCSRLKKTLPSGCAFIRLDLPWSVSEVSAVPKASGRFVRSVLDIQPPSSVILDLRMSEEEILASMKSKTRYNIRLAQKKGIEVVEGSDLDLDTWYSLYEETARRDRISLHGKNYYRALFETASGMKGIDLKLLLARHEGETIAGIIVLLQGKRATYLYGASSDEKRNLMPAYALQWHAVRYARSRGCMSYDMFGIPPTDDPGHPMAGLYRFKTGFGGMILHRPGCWDYPIRKGLYRTYRLAESLRYFYHKKWKKIGRNQRSAPKSSE